MHRYTVIQTPDSLTLFNKAYELITQQAEKHLVEKNRFVMILAGGNTPRKVYSMLKNYPTDWSKWIFIYGDERKLPLSDMNRNSTMFKTELLDFIDIPESNHLIMTEDAKHYGRTIAPYLPADLAILGIGEDGHTASLFPNNLTHDLNCKELAIDINNAEKSPRQRVSLSYKALNQTKTVCFLATGDEKKPAIAQWQKNETLPFNHVHGTEETVLISDIQY